MFLRRPDGVKPDLYVVGKALGALSAGLGVVGSRRLWTLPSGDHGSTFGGNPLACAVGMAALDVIVGERLPERSAEMGAPTSWSACGMKSQRSEGGPGKGLLIGVEIREEHGTARPYCEKLMGLGILAKETHHQVIRFAPPLVMSREEAELGARPHREGARLADPPPPAPGVEGMREDSMAIRKLRNYVVESGTSPRRPLADVENPSTGGIIAQVPLSSARIPTPPSRPPGRPSPGWARLRSTREWRRCSSWPDDQGQRESWRAASRRRTASPCDARAEVDRTLENVETSCGMPVLQQGDKLIGAAPASTARSSACPWGCSP